MGARAMTKVPVAVSKVTDVTGTPFWDVYAHTRACPLIHIRWKRELPSHPSLLSILRAFLPHGRCRPPSPCMRARCRQHATDVRGHGSGDCNFDNQSCANPQMRCPLPDHRTAVQEFCGPRL